MMDLNIKEPTTRNAKTTFQEIEKSAIKLFYKNGYHATTIADITDDAGVAAGTLYLYFPSKLVLYQHLLLTFSHNIRRYIAARVNKMESRYEKEREGVKAFIEYARKNPEMYNIIWESLYIDRDLFRDYYMSFAQRYKKGLDAAVKQGELRDVDTDVVSFVLMGIANFIGLKVVFKLGEHNEDLDYVVDVAMDLIKNGLFKERK